MLTAYILQKLLQLLAVSRADAQRLDCFGVLLLYTGIWNKKRNENISSIFVLHTHTHTHTYTHTHTIVHQLL